MIPAKDPKPVRSLQMFRTFSLMSCSDIVNSLDIHGEQLNFMYFATPRTAALLLGRKTQTFSGTNQKPKRLQLSGTMSPGALLPILYFSSRHLFQPSDFPSLPLSAPGSMMSLPAFQGKKVITPSWSLSIPLFFTTKINKYSLFSRKCIIIHNNCWEEIFLELLNSI